VVFVMEELIKMDWRSQILHLDKLNVEDQMNGCAM